MANDNIKLDDLVGKELDDDMLQSLVTDGRIKFLMKEVVRSSAVSHGGTQKACQDIGADAGLGIGSGSDALDEQQPIPNKDDRIRDLINNVKDNEDLIKALEDMRDEMLKNMSIPPANKNIADAAKKLGSKDGNITKDIFDKAEMITDPDYIAAATTGNIPKLMALTGNGNVTTPPCYEVTKAIFDHINVDEINAQLGAGGASTSSLDADIARTNQKFADMMSAMMMDLINKLFWNYIWARIWTSVFDLVEKTIAKPIDALFIVLKSLIRRPPHYVFSTRNYYKYGPVHKILNKLKQLFLCKIPKWAWPKYKPEPEIQIYIYDIGMKSLIDVCDNIVNDNLECVCDEGGNCADPSGDKPQYDPSIDDTDDVKNLLNEIGNRTNEEFSKSCEETNLFEAFKNLSQGDNPTECIEAAKTVIEAVYNDALYGD